MARKRTAAHTNSRREFLKTTAAAATVTGFWAGGGVSAEESKSPNEKIQFGCIGVQGKGSSDSQDAGSHGQVVAVCDIDEGRLEAGAKKFKDSEKFFDYREMLDRMGDKIDAVTVSTPDHTHAVAAAKAMRMGKHCFCQKPLTHTMHEARVLANIATEKKVCTQMGNQGTAGAGLRKGAAQIKAGALGTVTEVHVWTNRPVWPQGGARPKESEAPASVKWELFLGPAPYRPFGAGYHPFSWRGWWDFGTGALGDMACHTLNLAFMGLDLRDATSITAETAGHNRDSFPKWSLLELAFPERAGRPALKMFWYDGGKRPPEDLLEGVKAPSSGLLVVGSKGKLFSGNDYGGDYKLLAGAQEIEGVEFVQSPGHFTEFANAIKQGKPELAVSNFPGYASPLTETVLLGNLGVYAANEPNTKVKVEWNSAELKSPSHQELLAGVIKHEYREGYTL